MAKKRTTKTGLDYSTAEVQARKYYIENKSLTQDDVAKMVGVTRGTLNKWSQAGDWDSARGLSEMTPLQIERMVKEQMRKLLSDETTEEEQGIAIRKADALSKMNGVLKTLSDPERKVLNALDTFEEFNIWLAHIDLEYSKSLSKYQLEYITYLTKKTSGQN